MRDGGDWYETAVRGCSPQEERLTPDRTWAHYLCSCSDTWVSPLLLYDHDIWLGLVYGTGQRKGALFYEDNVV